MNKYNRETILRQMQAAYVVVAIAIAAMVALIFSTAWVSYELQRENELLKKELENTGLESEERIQVRSIEKPVASDAVAYRRPDDAGKRFIRERND